MDTGNDTNTPQHRSQSNESIKPDEIKNNEVVQEKKSATSKIKSCTSTLPETVGITQFMTKTPGFSAILKQRYEDFHVTEVSNDGQLAVITSLLEHEHASKRSKKQ